MSFTDDIQHFIAKANADLHAVHDAASDLTFESIVEGSAITGAPGQPVAQSGSPNDGELHDSWTKTAVSPTETLIATDSSYAQDVEDNIHGFHFANHGPHSVAMTRLGFDAIVDAAVARVVK